jgi:hypothetical protein
MNEYMSEMMAREHRRDLLRGVEQARVAQAALAGRSGQRRAIRLRLGDMLVAIGRRLKAPAAIGQEEAKHAT